jgi:hypothetical protein
VPMTSEDAERESLHRRHPLGDLIDGVITAPETAVHGTANYFVRRHGDGTLTIYRVIEEAASRDELSTEGDYIDEFCGVVRAAAECGHIEPPEDGWTAEIDALAELREDNENP